MLNGNDWLDLMREMLAADPSIAEKMERRDRGDVTAVDPVIDVLLAFIGKLLNDPANRPVADAIKQQWASDTPPPASTDEPADELAAISDRPGVCVVPPPPRDVSQRAKRESDAKRPYETTTSRRHETTANSRDQAWSRTPSPTRRHRLAQHRARTPAQLVSATSNLPAHSGTRPGPGYWGRLADAQATAPASGAGWANRSSACPRAGRGPPARHSMADRGVRAVLCGVNTANE